MTTTTAPQNIVTNADNVQVSHFSELMQNYSPITPVSASTEPKAIMDSNNSPVILTAAEDTGLFMIYENPKSETAWKQFDLSENLGTTTAFDVKKTDTDEYVLVLASHINGTPSLHTAKFKSFAALDSKDFDSSTFWTSIKLEDKTSMINLVSTDGENIMYATATENDAKYYTVDASNTSKQYTLPENSNSVIEFSVGSYKNSSGAFLLYNVGDQQSLLFKSFKVNQFNKFTEQSFTPPKGSQQLKSFQLTKSSAGNDAIIACGQGVYLFEDENPTTVVEEKAGFEFTKIRIASGNSSTSTGQTGVNSNKLSFWLSGEDTTTQQSGLYYLSNQFYSSANGQTSAKFNSPILMQSNVDQFAPLIGDDILNHLFLINSSNQLSHFYQAKSTTLWKQVSIPVESVGNSMPYNSYTLDVQFSTATYGVTFNTAKVTLHTSAATYITVNGSGYRVGPNKSVTVPLEFDGSLNIINKTDAIHAPTLYINSDFLNEEVSIELPNKIISRLQTVQKGPQLTSSKFYNGSTLYSDRQKPPSSTTATNTVNGIQSFIKSGKQIGTIHNGTSAEAIENHSYSLHFNSDGSIDYKSGQDTEDYIRGLFAADKNTHISEVLKSESVGQKIGHFFGDIFHWIKNEFDKLESFVVHIADDVARFVIKIGKDIYNFIVKTAEEIYAGLKWLFQKIATFFKDLIKWLGFLFDWKDFLLTKNAIKAHLQGGIGEFKSSIEDIQKAFDNLMETIIKDINQPNAVSNYKKNITNHTNNDTLSDVTKNHNSTTKKADPRKNWVHSKRKHLEKGDPKVEGIDINQSDFENFGSFITDTISNLESVLTQFKADYESLHKGDITVREFILKLLEAAATGIIKTIQEIIDSIFEWLIRIIDVVDDALTAPIPTISLFSHLYADITKTKQNPKGDTLTILDLSCLLMGIVATISCKLATDKSPLQLVSNEDFASSFKSTISNMNSAIDCSTSTDNKEFEKNLSATTTSQPPSKLEGVFTIMGGSINLVRVATFPISQIAQLINGFEWKIGVLWLTDRIARMERAGFTSYSIFQNSASTKYSDLETYQKIDLIKTYIENSWYIIEVVGGVITWIAQYNNYAKTATAIKALGIINSIFVVGGGVTSAVQSGYQFPPGGGKLSPVGQSTLSAQVFQEIFQITTIGTFASLYSAKESEDVNVDALIALAVFLILNDIGLIGNGVSAIVAGSDLLEGKTTVS